MFDAPPSKLSALTWPARELPAAFGTLVNVGRLSEQRLMPTPLATPRLSAPVLDTWLQPEANRYALETEQLAVTYPHVLPMLRRTGPVVFLLDEETTPRLLILAQTSRRAAWVLTPDQELQKCSLATIQQMLCASVDRRMQGNLGSFLETSGIARRRQGRVRQAFLQAQLKNETVAQGWLIRPAPHRPFVEQCKQAKLGQTAGRLLGAHLASYALFILSWWVLGHAVFQGRLEEGWLIGWLLLLLTLWPLRAWVTWLTGMLALRGGLLLRRRLLYGILQLAPQRVKREGIGQQFSRVVEADALESLALNGGILGVMAALELLVAVGLFFFAATSLLHAVLIVAWIGISSWLGYRYWQQRTTWAHQRLYITDDLLERMMAHRTRLAQESPNHWHTAEDHLMTNYLGHATRMDRSAIRFAALIPRGWMLVGLLGVMPFFLSATAQPSQIAITIGTTLLAYLAFERITQGFFHIVDAVLAWNHIAPLREAANQPMGYGHPQALTAPATSSADQVLLEGQALAFTYASGERRILDDCAIRVHAQDRILLLGTSGSGKSTLAALLAGLERPESGLLLLQGLDRHTLGDVGWRKRVAFVPQFHDNYVFNDTFVFNALMGRAWPPSREDLEACLAVCQALGLGPLLERMPGGLQQMLGESGWQLSHGERSRLFLARALLQQAEVLILDECFATLDPETLSQTMTCVHDQANAVVVIAHP